jgi:ABC-type glycerol-3-phosphate transport system permease component
VLLVSSLSAYVFARMHFRFKTPIYYAILSLMMVPGVLTLVPSVILVRQLGLFNTYGALILPAIAGSQVFAIFILRGFFAGLPEDYFAAARVDGATELQCYWYIALPLSKPIMATIAIMVGVGVWNDYVWPLLVASDESLRTVSVGLQFFRTSYRVDIGELMAGNVLASIPLIILFAFASGTFVKGLSTGGIKA